MLRPGWRTAVHGAVGGLIAGAFVALWFYVRDLSNGIPLHTPAVLAGIFLGQQQVTEPTARLVLTYTVLHFAVFIVLGVALTSFMSLVRASPGLAFGALLGLGVLDTVHYGALLLVNQSVLTVLPVGHVLLANVLAGALLMLYLHFAADRDAPFLFGAVRRIPLLAEGLTTGLVGAGAVALWFFIVDVITSRPFFTPAALGSAVFLGAQRAAEVQVTFGVVAAYTVLHIVAFLGVGFAFTWVAQQLERSPGIWLVVVMAFIVLEALFIGTTGLFSAWILGALGWWAVGVGNLVAVGTMGTWVLRHHPVLEDRLLQEPVDTRV